GLELLAYANETEDRTEGIISHFAVEVDDMKQAIAQLKEMQIPLETEEPRDAMGKKIFFFTGPNGEKIEMVQEAK
ncbi:MAG: VOC family protein, partial [Firmicutes bacterium]|nr:VOC family protein [Bacillota bacterium]